MNKLILAFSTITILLPSLLNGFPFVYFDTGFFLFYANNLFSEPAFLFRPLTYSAMIAATHSVFFLIFIQCALLNILIFKTAELQGLSRRSHFLAILLGTLLTPMALYSNFVLADIFIAIQFLALFNYLYSPGQRGWRIFFAIVFVICGMTHYSNLILSGIVVLIGLLHKTKRKLVAVLLLPILILPFLHLAIWQKFTFTNSAYFFLFSRMTALGVSQTYLAEKCQIEKLKLCVVPVEGFDPWDWSPKGTIAKTINREDLQDELRSVCLDVLTTPHLLFEFARKSAVNWGRQFILFSRPPEIATDDLIVQQNLFEFNKFEFQLLSKQSFKSLNRPAQESLVETLSHLYLISVLVSIGVFGLIVRTISKIQLRFFSFLLVALVLNSFICGVFTEPADRYQGRLIFLFPVFVFYILVDRLNKIITGRDSGRATMS